jgi:hippurate hydrolase
LTRDGSPEISDALHEDMRRWRHDLHRHPEFGFEEQRTAGLVADALRSFGLEVHTGIGTTGVVGVLQRGTSNRAIGLRADMDCLLIQEQNTFEHRSVHDGKMHACGHDGHTSMLLGAAKHLSASEAFNGTEYFIFQPAEEHGAGAQSMIDDGLFERFSMESVYAIHNMPGIPAGKFAVKPGPIMSSEDNFEILVRGRGVHASMPHQGIDPIVIASEIVLALQTIVSRSINPVDVAVVSVTDISSDGTRNVLPTTATLRGDVRSFVPSVQSEIERVMERIVAGICAANGAEYEFSYTHDFVPTINSEVGTGAAITAARRALGDDNVITDIRPASTSEDFARMLQVKPGCYALIGNGGTEPGGCGLHNPNYDFNDQILPVGAAFWVSLVETQFPIPR